MEYYFKPSALRDLKKLPEDKQVFIIKKLDFYTSQSNPLKFAKKMMDKAFGSIWKLHDILEMGNFIIHLDNKFEPLYMEILNAKDFILQSTQSVIKSEETIRI